MGRRGRKRRLAIEDEYWRLMGSGVGTVEACRRVGIGRYLSLLERERIAALRRMGMGVRQIAREIGRNPSTVSRELKRNARVHDRGVYDAVLAHARAREKAGRAKTPILAAYSGLTDQADRTWLTSGVGRN